MRRVAIFAHYDSQDRVKRYVIHHLSALREVCSEVHFASTAKLSVDELAAVDGIVASQHLSENKGYDFGMWRRVLATLDLGDWDELVLTNSSVLGPLVSLVPVFRSMQESTCDFWGMSDNLDFEYHLQSYFLVFRKPILHSGHLEAFFSSVLPYQHKEQTILSYEVGLTHFLLDQGFAPDVVASVFDFDKRLRRSNALLYAPISVIDRGVPYVKAELLRDNPHQVCLAAVRKRMEALGYPWNLVEIERRPPRRLLPGSINRLRFRMRRRFQSLPSELRLRAAVLAMLDNRNRIRHP